MKIPYNGHESWNAWNVSLWIGNDEGLYRLGLECLRWARLRQPGRSKVGQATLAARRFIAEHDVARTPDGARYSLRSVRLALEGLES